ncbi:MAG: DEAD/DEAH box helicase, partial [Thermoplasmata archaeon]
MSKPPTPPAPLPRSLAAAGIQPEIREILRADGIQELYPPQAEAIPIALAGQSLLLACPTAAGKSLVAYLALLRA